MVDGVESAPKKGFADSPPEATSAVHREGYFFVYGGRNRHGNQLVAEEGETRDAVGEGERAFPTEEAFSTAEGGIAERRGEVFHREVVPGEELRDYCLGFH